MAQALNYAAQTRIAEAGNGLFARASAWFADYKLYRRTVEELSQLSDRELADLGISRLSIGDIARESVYGR